MAQTPPHTYVNLMERYAEEYGSDYDDIKYYELCQTVFAEAAAAKEEEDGLVVVFDNMKRYQNAVASYVEANPAKFGLSAGQMKHAPALKWGKIKPAIEADMLGLAQKGFLIAAVHLKDEWQNDGPTGVRIPDVVNVMTKIASMFIWLRATESDAPAGLVLKDRISLQPTVKPKGKKYETIPADLPEGVMLALNRKIDEYEMTYGALPEWGKTFPLRIFPRRLPEASWDMLRYYMTKPADWENPRPGEVPSKDEVAILQGTLTEEKKKILDLQLAQLRQAEKEAEDREKAIVKKAQTDVRAMVDEAGVDADTVKAELRKRGVTAWTADNADRVVELAETIVAELKAA